MKKGKRGTWQRAMKQFDVEDAIRKYAESMDMAVDRYTRRMREFRELNSSSTK